MSIGQLDANLRRFYAEARKKSGETYSRSTILGFRHAIERYLNAPPLNKGLKLLSDPRFKRSNEMLNAQIVALKRQGKENTMHKPPIENEALMKLKTSQALSHNNPLALLRNVWFHVVLFFCRRGREGQRELKRGSFKAEMDASGRRYTTMAHDEATKNHQGGVQDVPSTEKYARMYETQDANDGYKAFQLYTSKLSPNCESFFQYPRKNFRVDDSVWYEARPLGVNSLGTMMKKISEAVQDLHQPQRQGHCHNLVVERWNPQQAHHGNLRPPKWAKPCTLQHASIHITAPQLQWGPLEKPGRWSRQRKQWWRRTERCSRSENYKFSRARVHIQQLYNSKCKHRV